jgi:hypothetical protein
MGLSVVVTKARLRDALAIVRVDRPSRMIRVSCDSFRTPKTLKLDSQAQAKAMILFHDHHASNVAVDFFAKPTSHGNGIAELGVDPPAVCSATTTSTLVPKQCKYLQPKTQQDGSKHRSSALPTLPFSKNLPASVRT